MYKVFIYLYTFIYYEEIKNGCLLLNSYKRIQLNVEEGIFTLKQLNLSKTCSSCAGPFDVIFDGVVKGDIFDRQH